jgi:hypothetical protein
MWIMRTQMTITLRMNDGALDLSRMYETNKNNIIMSICTMSIYISP